MKDLAALEHYLDHEGQRRIKATLGWDYDPNEGGIYELISREDNRPLKILASIGLGWDHVSVSRLDRAPTWAEMEQVKRLFFRADETAMQLHVPAGEHIDCHPNCLHLWRPQEGDIPSPPSKMVA